MCGICGKISIRHDRIEEGLLREMTDTLFHRGPDDGGTHCIDGDGSRERPAVGLGHRRLSIIDLSAAGHQPMCNEDGSVWISFNGEIYNFSPLKSELEGKGHVFRSNTDTEVIIHLYEEEGVNAVARLNGMFAFAVWDQRRGRLWLCRDRLGVKPLVYWWDGSDFLFASEIKALLKDPIVARNLDYDALQLYLTFNYVPAPLTMFQGIRKLPPGHSLLLEKGEVRVERYWSVPRRPDPELASLPLDEQENIFKSRLRELLFQAVRDRLVSDVPLGAFLSGGIDSSIVVALMARASTERVRTFSIGFRDNPLFDETSYARLVANHCNTEHHEFKLVAKDMLDVLPEILAVFDEPFADSSAIPTHIVSRETRRHVTVALSGDGGDELFAGYRSYLAEHWRSRYLAVPALLREGIFENMIGFLPERRDHRLLEYVRRTKKFIKGIKGDPPERFLRLKEVFPAEIRGRILRERPWKKGDPDPALDWLGMLLREYEGDSVNALLYTDVADSLPGDMLTKVDWMSMRNALEVRGPLLDYRVAELAFSFPGPVKLRGGQLKHILKETFRDILPGELYTRPKAGFEVPVSAWLRDDLKFLLDDYLAPRKIADQGIFDESAVRNLVEAHLSGRADTSWHLWNLIVFQEWLHRYC